MSPIIWVVLAIAVGLAGGTALAWFRRPKLPPLEPGTELPATPLQRLARGALVLAALPAIAALALVLRYGSQRVYDDDALRTVFTVFLLAIIIVFLVVTVRIKSWVTRQGGALDERDRVILSRASVLQSPAMLVTLAAWIIGLAERFHAAGAVPLFYLYLVFWSCWAANLLAYPLGILVGYRRG